MFKLKKDLPNFHVLELVSGIFFGITLILPNIVEVFGINITPAYKIIQQLLILVMSLVLLITHLKKTNPFLRWNLNLVVFMGVIMTSFINLSYQLILISKFNVTVTILIFGPVWITLFMGLFITTLSKMI